jgi:glycosyltransferase involved in cell wall biosynthesis
LTHSTFTAPRTVFGLPTFNHARKLREALDSLLSQTERDFCIVVCDDHSTDDTPKILGEYAKKDNRVLVFRADKRLGYIGNARRCFELARKLHPTSPFFAWASDHDVWHPLWLESLRKALDEHPEAVVACPLVYRIDADGSVLAAKDAQCTTVGEPLSFRRFSKTFKNIAAGNMVYGLMRASALEKAGVLPWHLLPDRLLLVVLALYGTMVSVPEYLWSRRYRGLASIDRQIRASFLDAPPAYLKLPWWLAHTGYLFRTLALSPEVTAPFGRGRGAAFASLYLFLGAQHVLKRRARRYAQRTKAVVKPARSAAVAALRSVWRSVS